MRLAEGGTSVTRTARSGVQRPVRQRLALQLGVILVMLGFQVNMFAIGSPVVYVLFYSALLACFLVAMGGRVWVPALLLLFGAMFVTSLSGNPLKGLGLGVGAYLGHLAATRYEADYRRVMTWLLAVNILIVVIQILGIWPAAYRFVNYPSQSRLVNVLAEPSAAVGFLPQLRPSGIFPSMTFVSAYSVLLYSTVIAAPGHAGRAVSFAAGAFLALLGSSVGLVLALGSAALMLSRRALRFLVYGYVAAAVLYAILLPAQFAYSFNTEEIRISFMARLDPNSGSVESVLRNNLAAAVALCLGGVAFLAFAARFGSLSVLLPAGVAVALPILVHDITPTLFYWFLLGAVTAPVLRRGGRRALVAAWKESRGKSGWRWLVRALMPRVHRPGFSSVHGPLTPDGPR